MARDEALSFHGLNRIAYHYGWDLRLAKWEGAPETYQVPQSARSDAERFTGWLLGGGLGDAVALPMRGEGMRVLQLLPPGLDVAWVGEASSRAAAMAGRLGALEEDRPLAPMALAALLGQPEWQALRDIAARQRGRMFRVRSALDPRPGAVVEATVCATELPPPRSSFKREGWTTQFGAAQWRPAGFVAMHDMLMERLSEGGQLGGADGWRGAQANAMNLPGGRRPAIFQAAPERRNWRCRCVAARVRTAPAGALPSAARALPSPASRRAAPRCAPPAMAPLASGTA